MDQNNQLSASERMARLTNQMNQPAACEKCGSTWFAELTFNQYSGGMYSSAPGGDLRVISTMPQAIRVCLCGHPVSPNIGGIRGGRQPNAELGSFSVSLQSAGEHRSMFTEIEDKLKALIKSMALQADLDAVKEELAQLRKLMTEKAEEPKKNGKRSGE